MELFVERLVEPQMSTPSVFNVSDYEISFIKHYIAVRKLCNAGILLSMTVTLRAQKNNYN